MAPQSGKRKGTQVTSITLVLRCSSCNEELEIHYIHMVTETSPPGARVVAVKPHVCPTEAEVPPDEPCDLTEGCCRKGLPLDDTTHIIEVYSEDGRGVELILMSLSFHPECCPHWLAGNPCDKRHGGCGE